LEFGFQPSIHRHPDRSIRRTAGRRQGRSGARAEVGLGLFPSPVGRIALLPPLVERARASLIALVAAYIGTVLVEQETAKRDLLSPRFLWLGRGCISVTVAIMMTVLTLPLLGRTIGF
jgi:hypothetical protein